MTVAAQMECRRCGNPYLARITGGSEQRFCSRNCRLQFHKEIHAFGATAFERGVLTRDNLKRGRPLSVRDDLVAFILGASKEFDELVGHIHDELSDYEQAVLPAQVWALVWRVHDFVCNAEERVKEVAATRPNGGDKSAHAGASE